MKTALVLSILLIGCGQETNKQVTEAAEALSADQKGKAAPSENSRSDEKAQAPSIQGNSTEKDPKVSHVPAPKESDQPIESILTQPDRAGNPAAEIIAQASVTSGVQDTPSVPFVYDRQICVTDQYAQLVEHKMEFTIEYLSDGAARGVASYFPSAAQPRRKPYFSNVSFTTSLQPYKNEGAIIKIPVSPDEVLEDVEKLQGPLYYTVLVGFSAGQAKPKFFSYTPISQLGFPIETPRYFWCKTEVVVKR